jgi:hemerythrin-like domain-containing protein
MRLNVLEETLKQILNELKEIKTDIHDLKDGQARLEVGQNKLQKNLIDSLGSYTEKIVDHLDDKTQALNKRVYNVESEIERLSKQ